MPYLRGQTQAVSKGLELRRYNVPYHAIGRITNKDAMYWYRAELTLAQNSLVGTTIKVPIKLPAHIALDEHHSRLNQIHLAGVYPIYASEIELVEDWGLEKFWHHPNFSLYDVDRKKIVRKA